MSILFLWFTEKNRARAFSLRIRNETFGRPSKGIPKQKKSNAQTPQPRVYPGDDGNQPVSSKENSSRFYELAAADGKPRLSTYIMYHDHCEGRVSSTVKTSTENKLTKSNTENSGAPMCSPTHGNLVKYSVSVLLFVL